LTKFEFHLSVRKVLQKMLLLIPFILVGLGTIQAQTIPTSSRKQVWVDSLMTTLSVREQIAQSFMAAAYTHSDEPNAALIDLIQDMGIGGIIFMQGNPTHQVTVNAAYQEKSKIPLLMATDAEWGLSMRLSQTTRFPFQMALGALRDDGLIYQMGFEIGLQMRRLGLHVNFAPVIDINNNPLNPVINYRSFGENRIRVTQKSIAYMKGLQAAGIMAVAKHFPGHGDTQTDSHYGLPIIEHNRARLDSIELYPFQRLIQEGVDGIMMAHINVPALDSTPKLAATLSKKIVTDLLKTEMGFKGLIFTDAMNMKGVTSGYDLGEPELMAYLAGNDIIEFSLDISASIAQIEQAFKKGRLTSEQIDTKCRRILHQKYKLGLHEKQFQNTENTLQDINNQTARDLNNTLTKASLTVLKKHYLGSHLKGGEIATLSINTDTIAPFQKEAIRLGFKDHFYLPKKATQEQINEIEKKLEDFERIYLGVIQSSPRPYGQMKISNQNLTFVNELAQDPRVMIGWFGNPYTLNQFNTLHQSSDLVIGYQNNPSTQSAMTQLFLGDGMASGTLPVTVNSYFKLGDGIVINKKPEVGAAQFGAYLPILKNKKVGLVVNQTSTVRSQHLVDTLLSLGIQITKIFAPEHGFRGDAHDGATIYDNIDQSTGLPIISIYGKQKKPSPEQLKDLDILIFDIQDVGARFYTFISTLHYVMEAAAENNKKVIVLDRPNPNGDYVDGPVLKPAFKSFVGMHPLPIVHGLTIGELAKMINGEGWLAGGQRCDLEIIKIKNYSHAIPWALKIPPSPNLPNDRAVRWYPSLCLFEATVVSIGRGTYAPFQQLGAPQINSDFSFTPKSIKGMSVYPKHLDTVCYGEDLTATESIPKFNLSLLIKYYHLIDMGPDFFNRKKTFNQLAGNDQLMQQIISGMSEEAIQMSWAEDLADYRSLRKKYLLYD
jgi:beta-N-acetylhexosaminidase